MCTYYLHSLTQDKCLCQEGTKHGFQLVLGEILTSTFRALVKNPVKESFDVTFMGNEKSCQNINCFFFFFFHKNFL